MVAIALAASATAASAAPYFGLGIGSSADLNGNLSQFSDDGRSYRLFGGYRFIKYLSLEATVSRFGEANRNSSDPYEATSLGAAAKGSLPLGSGFEAYARLGLQHTWLTSGSGSNSFDGTGYLLGAGFEYRYRLAFGTASVFADYQRLDAVMSSSEKPKSVDQSAGLWTLGVALTL